MTRYKTEVYKKIKEREKELRAQGRKGSSVWNKLHMEFPKYKQITLLHICRNQGVYKNRD